MWCAVSRRRKTKSIERNDAAEAEHSIAAGLITDGLATGSEELVEPDNFATY